MFRAKLFYEFLLHKEKHLHEEHEKYLDLYLQPVLTSLHSQCQKTLIEFSFSTHHPCLHHDNLISHLCLCTSTTASCWFCCFSHPRSFCVFLLLDFASLGVLPPYWAFVFQTIETENNKSHWPCSPAWSVTPGWGVWVLTRAVTASACPQEGLYGHEHMAEPRNSSSTETC